MISYRIIRLLRLLPVIAVFIVVAKILLTNQFVPSGKQVRALDIAIDTVRAQNEILEQQVASASSLVAVSQKASEIGFVEPTKSQLLTVSGDHLPVALK